jgi:hypothetical protein
MYTGSIKKLNSKKKLILKDKIKKNKLQKKKTLIKRMEKNFDKKNPRRMKFF